MSQTERRVKEDLTTRGGEIAEQATQTRLARVLRNRTVSQSHVQNPTQTSHLGANRLNRAIAAIQIQTRGEAVEIEADLETNTTEIADVMSTVVRMSADPSTLSSMKKSGQQLKLRI